MTLKSGGFFRQYIFGSPCKEGVCCSYFIFTSTFLDTQPFSSPTPWGNLQNSQQLRTCDINIQPSTVIAWGSPGRCVNN